MREMHPPVDTSDRFSRDQVLLAHIWQAVAQSKKPHPFLADAIAKDRKDSTRRHDPQRARRLAEGRQRALERLKAIEAGVIT